MNTSSETAFQGRDNLSICDSGRDGISVQAEQWLSGRQAPAGPSTGRASMDELQRSGFAQRHIGRFHFQPASFGSNDYSAGYRHPFSR